VVTLTPSSTEVVAAVGGLDLLVGVDQFSAYPPGVEKLPKVGDFLHPNVEAILALGCDSHACVVVLDATQNPAKEKLESFGIRTVTSAMQNLSDVRDALARVGRALGREEAATRAIAAFDADLAAAETRATTALRATGGHKPRVVLVVDRRPGGFAGMVAAGPDTYLDELLRRAGGENVLADSPVRYTQISAEEILSRSPDVVIDVTHVDDSAAASADWNALAQVPAVKNGRVHVLADPRFLGPGPRLGGALHRLVDLLWPPAPK
jgi:iron complex transport system substrate-binding protein